MKEIYRSVDTGRKVTCEEEARRNYVFEHLNIGKYSSRNKLIAEYIIYMVSLFDEHSSGFEKRSGRRKRINLRRIKKETHFAGFTFEEYLEMKREAQDIFQRWQAGE